MLLSGTYNDAVVAGGAATPCKPCSSPGLTTQAAGSSSAADCQLCLPGWGGTGCGSKCGGEGVNATYGACARPYNGHAPAVHVHDLCRHELQPRAAATDTESCACEGLLGMLVSNRQYATITAAMPV